MKILRRHKIEILKNNGVRGEYGSIVDEWVPYKTDIWADKSQLVGKEFYTALANDSNVDTKFTTGYITGVTSDMRIKHGTDIYEIIGQPINVKDRNMELLYYCRMVK